MRSKVDEILGGGFDVVWFRSAEGLAVTPYVDQDKPPVRTRVGKAPNERAKVSAGPKDAVQYEHVTSGARPCCRDEGVEGKKRGGVVHVMLQGVWGEERRRR